MPNSSKNIVITPNISSISDNPKIVFSGADTNTAAQDISMTITPANSGTLSFDALNRQLFCINNSITGTLFSVADISGVPSIEILDTGDIKLAQYGGNVGIGCAPIAKLNILAATEQLRISYDTSNYWTDTIATTGARTLAGVGVGGSLTITPTSGQPVIINAPINQSTKTIEYSGTKVLTDAAVTSLFEIAIVGNSAGVGAFLTYSILATDATAVQMHSGFANIVGCSGSTGTITSAIAEAATEAACVTAAGTLTETAWAVTNGTAKITVTANFDSSLSTPTITMTYKLIVFGTNAVVLL